MAKLLLNVYCTHRSPPPLKFAHTLNARRDRTDPELAEHLDGFMGFVMGGGRRQMNPSRYHVLGHLGRVRHHLSVEVDERDMDAFARWATAANAIIFFTDSTVRTPDGAILVDPETGDAEDGVDVPYPPDALERKARSEQQLSSLGIRVPRSLPPVVSEVEVELREPREVIQRSLALFNCAVRAESLASKDPIPVSELKERNPAGFAAFSPSERAFIQAARPDQQTITNYVWRYEALNVLAWSVGAVAELPFPKGICDAGALAKTMFGVMEDFKPRPRSTAEFLDALDLHYRLHWATTDARVNETRPPPGVEPGVVAERHYALNWLTRFQEAEWDDVETPT
jgi:hypothetical protein